MTSARGDHDVYLVAARARIDPDLCEAMREAWRRSYEIARETCLAAREQYKRVYGRR